MTSDDAMESPALREQLAFLLLGVAADPDYALQPFLQWCLDHREAIRATALAEPASADERS
jgi:hypothetical protein